MPKTKLKTALNILSNLSLLILFIYGYLIEVYMELRKYESPLLAVALFLAYIILRIAYIAACCYQKNTEKALRKRIFTAFIRFTKPIRRFSRRRLENLSRV